MKMALKYAKELSIFQKICNDCSTEYISTKCNLTDGKIHISEKTILIEAGVERIFKG